jgi:hypothetical protein
MLFSKIYNTPKNKPRVHVHLFLEKSVQKCSIHAHTFRLFGTPTTEKKLVVIFQFCRK